MNEQKKYIILLDENNTSAVKKAEKDLGITLTSSAELSSTVRAQQVFDSGNSLYLKNLGIAVLDKVEAEKIAKTVNKSSSSVIYWEEEQEFTTQLETDLIGDMRNHITQLSERLDNLEGFLKEKEKEKPLVENMTWGLTAIGQEMSKFTGKGIDIAILDTGFYLQHPDFVGRKITGKSFINDQAWDFDGNGHGTHCAGIAAGYKSLVDGLRYGIAHNANLDISKVLGDKGNGSTSSILDAIDRCIEKKHKVISLSLGTPVRIGQNPSKIFEHIGNKALKNNCLIIAAAGNNSNRPNIPRPVSSPGNAESFMAVAALTDKREVAKFSNAGINVSNGGRIDVAAPGVSIFSSFSKNAPGKLLYKKMNGTSMAVPHVTGVAALYFEAFPNASASEIWLKLEKRSKQLSNQLVRNVGQGLIQSI